MDVGMMPDDDNAPIHASSAHPNVLAESTLGDLHEQMLKLEARGSFKCGFALL